MASAIVKAITFLRCGK